MAANGAALSLSTHVTTGKQTDGRKAVDQQWCHVLPILNQKFVSHRRRYTRHVNRALFYREAEVQLSAGEANDLLWRCRAETT